MVRNVLYLGLQLFNCLFKVFYICKFLFKLFLLTLNFLFKLFGIIGNYLIRSLYDVARRTIILF